MGNGAPSMARHGARSAAWSPPKATSRWDERPGLSTALREGLRPVEQIRQAVGNQMEIAIEGHARWNLPIALRIAEARACRLFAGSITSGGD
jgi:L-alanine-DL-glutamate epimerase-like enolase superfamily enzyme